jgi:hypothetical protein
VEDERVQPDSGDNGEDIGEDIDPAVDDTSPYRKLPPRAEVWRKRSAAGAVLTALALGLQEALDPQKKQPSIQMQAPSDPNDPDAPLDVHVEPNQPDETVVTVRPWRLQDSRD